MREARFPIFGGKPISEVLLATERVFHAVDEAEAKLRDIERAAPRGSDEAKRVHELSLGQAWSAIHSYRSFLQEVKDVDQDCLLITGDAGNGKSHLIGHLASEATKQGQPALLLLGEQFLDTRPPLTQICDLLHWDGSGNALLSALNIAAEHAEKPGLIFIDALNESRDRDLWRTQLHGLANAVRQFRHLRLVVSCRSDFTGLTLPQDILVSEASGFAVLEHDGLGDVLTDLVETYFNSFRISARHFPPLLSEFSNPLFLDTFCRAYEGRALPEGPLSLREVMKQRIKALSGKLERELDHEAANVREAIRKVAKLIGENGGQAIPADTARSVINHFSHDQTKVVLSW